MHTKNIYLFAFLLSLQIEFLSANTLSDNGSQLPFSSGETLHYRLSYQGLLTSLIWADLADAKMSFIANQKTPEQHNGYQFVLHLSTQNYTKAEIIHPVRLTYTATLDANMQRTLLVEKKDTGASQSHEFLWLDWHNKETQLFKKREKEQLISSFLGLGDKETWEKDGKQDIPEFLRSFPLLDEKYTYLVHKKSGNKITTPLILEPLSMIYRLRTLNVNTIKEIPLVIIGKIRKYHVKQLGLEEVDANGKKYQAVKYKIQKEGRKNKRFYVWLSNDKLKIPLRFAMDAALGQLDIQLVKVTGTNKLFTSSINQ